MSTCTLADSRGKNLLELEAPYKGEGSRSETPSGASRSHMVNI